MEKEPKTWEGLVDKTERYQGKRTGKSDDVTEKN